MSSPGDNMAQTEPEMSEEFKKECKNCNHERFYHFGRTGCYSFNDDLSKDSMECHCTNFEVKE